MPDNQSTPEVTRALKPCPRCKGIGVLRASSDGEVEWVRCKLCGHEGPLAYSPELAIAGWNDGLARPATAPARGGEELREALESIATRQRELFSGPNDHSLWCQQTARAALASPPPVDRAEAQGSFACPICGQDTPHHHTPAVVDAYQNKGSRA